MSSKWCCVLAVVCLSVILLSLDADAQPTVDDESLQCGSASQAEVVNMFRVIASNQQAMMDEMKTESGRVRAEMEVVKRLVLSPKQQLVSALVCEYVV